MNIQFVIKGNQALVLEVNPRASRTVPVVSKVMGVDMIPMATQLLAGATLEELKPATKNKAQLLNSRSSPHMPFKISI